MGQILKLCILVQSAIIVNILSVVNFVMLRFEKKSLIIYKTFFK